MKNKEEIKEVINYFQQVKGEGFEYDETAIMAEYEKIDANKSGLAIKILSIAGGFLATLALVAFLLIAGLYESTIGSFLLGMGFITFAIVLNRQKDELIADTLSVCLFISGFVLFGIALKSENAICLLFIGIAFISLCIIQNYILTFILTLTITGSILALIIFNNSNLIFIYLFVLAVALIYVVLQEGKLTTLSKKGAKRYNPVRTGLVFSFIIGLIFSRWINIDMDGVWFASFCLMLGAILIILLSFQVNYKTGLFLGILLFIYAIIQYYYDLQYTLLIKSGILFLTGILFILVYILITKKMIKQ